MLVDTDHLLSMSEAGTKGISRLAADAESGRDYVLLRNSKPVAAVVGMSKLKRLQALEDAEEDLRLMVLTFARVVTDTAERRSFDDVLRHFGLEEDDLVSPDDDTVPRSV